MTEELKYSRCFSCVVKPERFRASLHSGGTLSVSHSCAQVPASIFARLFLSERRSVQLSSKKTNVGMETDRKYFGELPDKRETRSPVLRASVTDCCQTA